MSDRYKFRAWDIEAKKMIAVVEMHFGSDGIDAVVWDGENTAYVLKTGQYILMQYTGHPNELWVGDKVRRGDGTEGVIVWHKFAFVFRVENEYGQHNIPLFANSVFEVIGTIHDKEKL